MNEFERRLTAVRDDVQRTCDIIGDLILQVNLWLT